MANVWHLTTHFISPQFHLVFDDLFETVNGFGVSGDAVEPIYDELFQLNRELFSEEELDEAGNIIYQPPPLHEVWLNEAGRHQGNGDCIRQRRRNDDLMCNRSRAVQQVITKTPVATGDVDDGPNMLPISDDGSLDSSLGRRDSESEGGIWDGHNNDFAPNAPEGAAPERAQLIPIDFDDNIGPSANSSPRRRPYDAGPHPPVIIEPQILAPEGAAPERATRRGRGKAKQYPPAVWRRGTDGKLERIATSVIRNEYKKLNRNMFALTFGHHDVPPEATRLSKKRQRLNYKQFSASLKRSGDMTLMSLTIDNTLPTITDLLASPLAK